jgi:glycosyltransferase involved in cell wall biosynthesis
MPARPRPTSPSISCVVPAYNESENLGPLLSVLVSELDALCLPWEVIVVDDGSTDATPLALAPWLLQPGVRCLRLSRNFGKEAALTAGIDHAEGEVVVLLDADLQHPPAMIGAMLDAWRQASGPGWVGACLSCHRLDPRLGSLDAIPRGFKRRGVKAVEIKRRPRGDSIREEIDARLVERAPGTGVEMGWRLVPWTGAA